MKTKKKCLKNKVIIFKIIEEIDQGKRKNKKILNLKKNKRFNKKLVENHNKEKKNILFIILFIFY